MTHEVFNQPPPLTTSAVTAARGRPKRSAAQPPARQPATPATPIATNASSAVSPVRPVRAVSPASRNAGSHVHSAYSSHMWPK